jgi:hypothetical protein
MWWEVMVVLLQTQAPSFVSFSSILNNQPYFLFLNLNIALCVFPTKISHSSLQDIEQVHTTEKEASWNGCGWSNYFRYQADESVGK